MIQILTLLIYHRHYTPLLQAVGGTGFNEYVIFNSYDTSKIISLDTIPNAIWDNNIHDGGNTNLSYERPAIFHYVTFDTTAKCNMINEDY